MRTTISLPEKFYERIKTLVEEEGYGSVNDFILEALREKVKTVENPDLVVGTHGVMDTPTMVPLKKPNVYEQPGPDVYGDSFDETPTLRTREEKLRELEKLRSIKADVESQWKSPDNVNTREAEQTRQFEEQMELRKAPVAQGEQKTTSTWPSVKFGKPLTGRTQACPVCMEVVPVEFSADHFTQAHADLGGA